MSETIAAVFPDTFSDPDPLAPLSMTERVDLSRDGFLSIANMTDAEDIAFIRSLIEPMLSDPLLAKRTVVRAMSEVQGGEPVREVINLVDLEPRLKESRFYRRAWRITQAMFGPRVELKFDHVIDKPPFNPQETAWHQDCAYSSRITRSAKRLHWWLPLQAVDEANGCMQFVAGSHHRPIQRHWPVSADGHIRATHAPTEAVTVCALPVGGATIHLPKTLHYTGANSSAGHRIAWIIQTGVTGWPTLL